MIACKTWQNFVVGAVARRCDVAEVRWWFVNVICRKKQISKPLQA